MEGTSSAVLKALTVLDYLGAGPESQRLKDLAKALDLPESTTHRLLNSLAARGYVQQNPRDQTYRLGWKIVALARTVNQEVHLVETIHPHLEQLAEKTTYTANLAVLQQDTVMYLDSVVPSQARIALYTTPGSSFPVHATALGRVLLAGLPADEADLMLPRLTLDAHTPSTITDIDRLRSNLCDVRSRGYAVDRGEFVPDVQCAAAPITDAGGDVIAAISVSARAVEFPPEREQEVISILIATAEAASRSRLDRVGP